MSGKPLQRLLQAGNVILLAGALWGADQVLSAGGKAGGERKTLRGVVARTADPKPDGLILLGSSTSRDWLPGYTLASAFRIDDERVVDGHVNGCHQGCTWAEVRRLLAGGRHFEVAIFGTNQFQLCELPHSKRVLQHRTLTPREDVGALFGFYAKTDAPLGYFGRFVGGGISAVYADNATTRGELARRLWGEPDPKAPAHAWYRDDPPPARPAHSCDYDVDDIAYKRALTEALLDDLGELADHTYLMLLPDVTLLDEEREEAWERHRALHIELAEAREHVTLIDLSEPRPAADYKDGFHLTRRGAVDLRRLFFRRLREGGHIP